MRCTFRWESGYLGPVQCWHTVEKHPRRHEAWESRKERRREPGMAAWVAVGAEAHVSVPGAGGQSETVSRNLDTHTTKKGIS